MEVLRPAGRTPVSGAAPACQTPERTPISMLASLAATPPTTTTKERISGQVASRLNPHLEEQRKTVQASDMPCKIRVLSQELPSPFRYMVETTEHKLSCLRWRLLDWQRKVQSRLTEGATCMPVNVITQEDVYVVGYIVCDAEGARLNAASTLLEGFTADGAAARVRLDLSQVPAFQIFPGQVIGARGFSLDGAIFIARELYTHLPRPLASISPPAIPQDTPTSWSMVIASGPFTASDNQEYLPLKALLDYCHSTNPSALLLLGPLVDERHPQLEQLDVPAQQLAEGVEKQLADWAEAHPGSRLLLMSSTRDVHHHPVFPTPPYNVKHTLGPKVVCLQNPCVFNCNDAVVGGCSSDVLLNLSGEVAQHGPHPDRLATIASNILGQHRFYPLFPPALGTCLDTSFHPHLELPITPNILLLPSELNAFAKTLPYKQTLPGAAPDTPASGNVVCINPGRLVKGKNTATFAQLTVLPAPSAQTKAPLAERCLVEIVSL